MQCVIAKRIFSIFFIQHARYIDDESAHMAMLFRSDIANPTLSQNSFITDAHIRTDLASPMKSIRNADPIDDPEK